MAEERKKKNQGEKKAEPKATPRPPRQRAAGEDKGGGRAPSAARGADTADAQKEEAPKPRPTPRGRARPARSREEARPAPERPVVRAQAKYVRSSARKARLVIEHIRGKPLEEARAVLRHSPRGIARELEKLLSSAVANAENNHDLVGDDLLVKDAYADEGPTLKRYRPRALGRATRIRKRTSHVTVALTPKE
jgi:ribosomal protein L22